MKKLLLVDGMALVYRAHFAFQKYPRRNSRGMNTSAIYGFMTSLLDLIEKEEFSHRAVAFDTSAPTFRHKMYDQYKADRERQPEDISAALVWIKQLLDALHIPLFRLDGFEADDIIGTLARCAAADGFEVLMMTPDKDFAQLIDQRVELYRPSIMKKPAQRIGLRELPEAFGVQRPEQIIDLLALQGDAVDQIPGVPGIGPKTAQALLAEHGSLEALLKLTSSLKKSIAEKLKTYSEQARLSQRLATIDTSVPIDWRPERCAARPPKQEALRKLFAELEFKTLARRLLKEEADPLFAAHTSSSSAPTTEAPRVDSSSEDPLQPLPRSTIPRPTPQYHLLENREDVSRLLPYLLQQQRVALQLYTREQRPLLPHLEALALAYRPEEAYVLLLPETKTEAAALLHPLVPFFEASGIEKVSASTKENILTLRAYDLHLKAPFFDITLAHYLCNPEANHATEALAAQYLDPYHYPALGQAPAQTLSCGQAALQILELHDILEQELSKKGRLSQVFQNIELPLIEVLSAMEERGILLRVETLQQLSETYAGYLQCLQEEIHQLAGQSFNISSPKQLGAILFDTLQLQEKPKKTKSGHYATGEEILQTFVHRHPIIEKILSFRSYQKLRSTYLEALPRFVSLTDGRIHTQYQQSVAATGRLSSNYPNLQNIPIRLKEGRQIREAFIAETGHKLISADYSQIELRILASFAEDEIMRSAFAAETDIHRATASQIFHCPPAEVNDQQRRTAKTANFGILYGISAFGLAQRLQISRSAAKELIDTYFTTFPQLQSYITKQQEQARKQGYVETYLGRRRYLPDINSRNATLRAFAERNAINAPIQGTAADIIKQAMCRVHAWLLEQRLRTRLLLQIHDELLLEVPEEELPLVQAELPKLMEEASELCVPLRVSIGVGRHWLEAHHA